MMKLDRGCENDSHILGRWVLDDISLQRCPLTLITRQSGEYLRAYRFYQKNDHPNAGGWREQPAKYLEAMELVDKEVSLIQKGD